MAVVVLTALLTALSITVLGIVWVVGVVVVVGVVDTVEDLGAGAVWRALVVCPPNAAPPITATAFSTVAPAAAFNAARAARAWCKARRSKFVRPRLLGL